MKLLFIFLILLATQTDKRWCKSVNEVSYSFSYTIDSGAVEAQHWEKRHNDIVNGAYSFLQPDGMVRVVDYQADNKRGVRMSVNYRTSDTVRGHLRFPDYFTKIITFGQPAGRIVDLLK